jgi:hypothetical protein
MVYPLFLGSYLCIYKYFIKECLRGKVDTQDWSKDVLVLACVWHSTNQKCEIVQPKSNCHRRMNRRPVGSSVRSSSAKEIFIFSQTHAQLLRHVIKSGRRIIWWWVSPRSSVAPMVRPTPLIFHRRFIRRYTDALVPPVISVGGLFNPF